MAARVSPDGPQGPRDPSLALGEAVLREAYERVVHACDHHGLPRADAEDLAQDFFLWLLIHPDRAPLLTGPCLGGVIRNYLLRYRRRTHRRRLHERPAVDPDFDLRGSSRPRTDETTISVRALERLLPETEARIIRHLKEGDSWSEAAEAVGIPQGSRDWLRKRIAGHVRTAFTAKRRAPAGRAAR